MNNFLHRLKAELFQRLIMVGAMLAIGAVLVGVSEFNRANNYIVTQAVVTDVVTDCFIEDSNSKLTEKGSNNAAYIPCDLAPAAAKEFNFSESAIKKRSKVTYNYVSPVDKQQHVDTLEDEPSYQSYVVGQTYAVLAHKKDVDKTLWGDADQQKALVATRGPASATASATKPTTTASVSGLRGKL